MFRRHLRFWVATWLVFQAASLSALVPRDCCLAHRPQASAKASGCHAAAATVTTCPMRTAGGTACPMHPKQRAGHSGAAERSGSTCSMRATCDGPMAALFALLSNHGVLIDSFAIAPDARASDVPASTRENPIGRLASPDPPPPRA